MRGELAQTILETVSENCQLLVAILMKGLVKTILEIAGRHRRLQAILVEGGLVKTILEIVVEPCPCKPLRARWAGEDHP